MKNSLLHLHAGESTMEQKKIHTFLNSCIKGSLFGLVLICIFIVQTGSASLYLQNGTEISGENLFDSMESLNNISSEPFPIQFFYNTHCGSCQEALDYLNGFTQEQPDMPIQFHDLYNSSENSSLYEEYKTRYNSNGTIHYPVVFIGDVAIVGSYDIASYTRNLSTWYQKNQKGDLISGLVSQIVSLSSGT